MLPTVPTVPTVPTALAVPVVLSVTTGAAPPSPVLVVVAALAVLAGATVLAVEAVAGRPRQPRATGERLELGDDPEPPALVGFLLGDFEVPAEAAAATLLHLAARGHCRIEQHGERVLCRVGATPSAAAAATGSGEQLTRYERLVLDHVQRQAVDGVLPAEALTTGPTAAAARWWRSLHDAVVAAARRDGLCRPRWRRSRVVLAGVCTAVALAALGLAGRPDGVSLTATPLAALVTLGAVGLLAAVGAVAESGRQTSTPRGVRVASRWMEVHDFLAAHADLTDMPPGGVVIWGRHLAYAAVMGLAPAAVAGLPLGAEDPRHAWSRAGGRWRPVVVSYPWWRPGWGTHPLAATATGLVVVAAAGALAWVTLRGAADPAVLWSPGSDTSAPGWLVPVAGAVGAAAVAVTAVALLRTVWAVLDLFGRRPVEGVVVRRVRGRVPDGTEVLRRLVGLDRTPRPPWGDHRYLAVDTGDADRVRAWSVDAEAYRSAHRGDRVRVHVTPRLGHVDRVEVLAADARRRQPVAMGVEELLRRAAAQVAALGDLAARGDPPDRP